MAVVMVIKYQLLCGLEWLCVIFPILQAYIFLRIIKEPMLVTLGGCGRGGRGGPLRCRERNPLLASNSRNAALLATTISSPPCALALSAAVLLHPPSAVAVPAQQYTTAAAASAHGSAPDDPVNNPLPPSSARSNASAALSKTALMMNILSKNDSSTNNQAYSLDAIRGMRDQLSFGGHPNNLSDWPRHSHHHQKYGDVVWPMMAIVLDTRIIFPGRVMIIMIMMRLMMSSRMNHRCDRCCHHHHIHSTVGRRRQRH